MPNTLTNLAPDLYKAADIVAREMIGFIPSATINGGGQQAAVGQTVRSFTTRTATAVNISPSMTIPEGTDQTIDNRTLTLTKQRAVQIPWFGEEVAFMDAGIGYQTVYGDQVQQAMRTLANEAEADLAVEIYRNASRAIGTAGTAPFGSNFNEVAQVRQILAENGMPLDNQSTLVLNPLAGTRLRNLAQLQRANENGSAEMLRQGTLLDLQGLMIKESQFVAAHTAGTGTSYLTNSTGLTVGTTVIPVDTGSGTILAGDVITFAADTANSYVVASALSGGNVTIAGPGLRVAIPDNNAVTVGAAYTANVAFHKQAAEIAFRAPNVPAGGDAADDMMTIVDPRSGLTFAVSFYKGYKKAMIEVAAVWGVRAWKPEFIATLRG